MRKIVNLALMWMKGRQAGFGNVAKTMSADKLKCKMND